jgi:hypothetical protein
MPVTAPPSRRGDQRNVDRGDLDHLEPDVTLRRVGRLLALAVVALPLLVPQGPGNTGAADLAIIGATVAVFLWLRRRGVRVILPYSLPVGLLMTAGVVAAHHAGVETAVLPVVQDGFCLAWGAAVANAVRQSRWLLEVFIRAWVYSGISWAAALCLGRVLGVDWLAGISAENGGRASLTFNDPNIAGNYFLCALALLLATSVVRRRISRVGSVSLILLAIVLTGSNGATIGLAAIVGVGLLVALRRHVGHAGVIVTVVFAAGALALAAPHVSLDQIRQQAADSVQVLRDSIGRSGQSSEAREELATESFDLYLDGDLVGVAPGRTKAALAQGAAPYVKEAHNDYLATLVERGALGGIGLVVLIAVISVRLGRVTFWPQTAGVRELVPRPEYLLGLGCAFAFAGLFYEVLHFRHLWAFLGLIAGIDPGRRIEQRRRPWDL